MAVNLKSSNIINSFKSLKGNARASVVYAPLWGIPYVLYNFYLSLYMKSQGVTDTQIGYLLSAGSISGAVFSLFGGVISDALGRKKTTLIFDFISWPLMLFIYAVSNNFWMFLIGALAGGAIRIVMVSYSLMIVEDADDEQRIAAFNILSIINISLGILTPFAGLMVGALGIVRAERVLLMFAVVSMTAMMTLRNRSYTETKIGRQILDRNGKQSLKAILSNTLDKKAISALRHNPEAVMIICVSILYSMYMPIGALTSMYFAPYMTEVIGIDKSVVSILGVVISATMLMVFIFVNPVISRSSAALNLTAGFSIQAVSLMLMIMMPYNNIVMASVIVALFSVGFGIARPFIDSILAQVTEGEERAGIYSFMNMITAVLSSFVGFASGHLYSLDPRLIYILSIFILLLCITLLSIFMKKHSKFIGID